MKNLIKITIVFLFLLLLNVSAQDRYALVIPDPPAPIDADSLRVINPNLNFNDFFEMDEKTEKELLKEMKVGLKKAMEVIKDVNKGKYYQFLRESQFKNMKIPFFSKRDKLTHERDQKIFELEVKAEALAVEYTKANEAEKNKIRAELKTKLSELFEEKEGRRKTEVKELEKELSELKKSLEVRKKNKSKIIERRIQELLNEDDYLDWD